MSWCRRRFYFLPVCLFAASLALSACGFRPLYGSGPRAAQRNLVSVAIDTIPDRSGQQLRNLLMQSMNPKGFPARPAYTLGVSLRESSARLGLQKDETATRASLTVVAQFTLADADTGKAIFRGTSRSLSNYDVVISDFATVVAENDAREKVLRAISQDITYRLALFIDRRNQEAGQNLSRPQTK